MNPARTPTTSAMMPATAATTFEDGHVLQVVCTLSAEIKHKALTKNNCHLATHLSNIASTHILEQEATLP